MVSQAQDVCAFAIRAIWLFQIALRVHPLVNEVKFGLERILLLPSAFSGDTYARSQLGIAEPPCRVEHRRSIRLTSDTQSPLSQALSLRVVVTAFATSRVRGLSVPRHTLVIVVLIIDRRRAEIGAQINECSLSPSS